jgi:predicted DNA-binding protein (MmcQ/YjbR family)
VTPEAFEALCLGLPAASKVVRWGGHSVYKLVPRVFAIAGFNRADRSPTYTFKVSDMAYELLIEHGLGRPEPYLRGAKWVQLTGQDALGDDDLRAYIGQAHALVAAKLTRAMRKELALAPG